MRNKRKLKTTNDTLYDTLESMGAITGISGFIIMTSEVVESATIKESNLIGMLGLTMLTCGYSLVKFLDSKKDICEDVIEDEEDSSIPNTSLIAWNDTYLSWMKMVEYRSQTDWDFVLITPSGEVCSKIFKSRIYCCTYTWEEMKER